MYPICWMNKLQDGFLAPSESTDCKNLNFKDSIFTRMNSGYVWPLTYEWGIFKYIYQKKELAWNLGIFLLV